MAVNYNTALKNTRMNSVVAAIDVGAGPGKLVIGTSALAGATGVLATIILADPSATVASATLTFSGMPRTATASAAGTAALAEIRDSNDAVVVSGLTVGTTGTDIIINSTSVAAAQTIQITSGTITHG
jgi:hypothetical protein